MTQQNAAEQQDPFGPPEGAPAQPVSVNMNMMIQEFIEVDRRIRELDEKLKEEKATRTRMESMVADHFLMNNIKNQKMAGGQTVYLRGDTYVSLVHDEDGGLEQAHLALRQHGLEYLVQDRVNANQLSGWYRKARENEEEIPEELLPFLNVSNVYRVRVHH